MKSGHRTSIMTSTFLPLPRFCWLWSEKCASNVVCGWSKVTLSFSFCCRMSCWNSDVTVVSQMYLGFWTEYISQLQHRQLSEAERLLVFVIGLEAKGLDYETQSMKVCPVIHQSLFKRARCLFPLAYSKLFYLPCSVYIGAAKVYARAQTPPWLVRRKSRAVWFSKITLDTEFRLALWVSGSEVVSFMTSAKGRNKFQTTFLTVLSPLW